MPSKFTSFILIIASLITVGWQITISNSQPGPASTNYVSCTQPASDQGLCAAQEAQLLASVVRLVFHAECQPGQRRDYHGSIGHATVMAGRYLVTHNHFSIDLAAHSPVNSQGLTGVSLYNAAGKRIVNNEPVESFQVAAQDAQTLVLDFGPDYFTNLNISSASFISAEDADLAVGTEVAQIDWDGERAYVIWTMVTRLADQSRLPHLELDNYVLMGASGGGVFWQGHHIANNWAHGTIEDLESGSFVRSYSLVALNSKAILR